MDRGPGETLDMQYGQIPHILQMLDDTLNSLDTTCMICNK